MKKTCYLLTLLILTLSAGMTRAQKITILGTPYPGSNSLR